MGLQQVRDTVASYVHDRKEWSELMAVQGTDGARGQWIESMEITHGDGVLSTGDVAGYSMALTEILGPEAVVVMGRDTRPSGEILKRYATAGIEAMGGTVVDVGIAPTPAIQKIALEIGAAGAISLTPSHNPYTDAGWKGMIGSEKPSAETIRAIDEHFRAIHASGVVKSLNPNVYDPRKHEQRQHLGRYMNGVIAQVRQAFGDDRPLEGKIVVADTARGAANEVTPVILERLGAEVVRFACDTDDLINHNAGATQLKKGLMPFLSARPELATHPRFVGATANDGDADRVMGVGVANLDGDSEFYTLDGNIALELLAPGQPGVVGTDYTNDATIKRIREAGTEFEFCRNGDVNVTRALQKNDWERGAEFSGHIVDLSWLNSGDGVRMAAWLLSFAAKNDTTFAEICQKRPLDPEKMVSVKLPTGTAFKTDWIQEVLEPSAADNNFGFRHLTRASGTEPLVRVWGVGSTQEYVDWRIGRIVSAIQQSIGATVGA